MLAKSFTNRMGHLDKHVHTTCEQDTQSRRLPWQWLYQWLLKYCQGEIDLMFGGHF